MRPTFFLEGVVPNWVEPDPLRSRATDALGLQAVADRLADRLLPGLSVLTTRARYFSFLCWARSKVSDGHDEHGIHRHEVALALTECAIGDREPEHAKSCSFVGSRNVKSFPRDHVPRNPSSVYKTPAWRSYRPAMVSLGLLTEGPRYALTDAGLSAAKRFCSAVRPRGRILRPLPPSACLSQISSAEIEQLRSILGISQRGRLKEGGTTGRTIRAAFAREIRASFRESGGLSPEVVLPQYEDRTAANLAEPSATLRLAAIWERLSLGLNMIFIALVCDVERGQRGRIERQLRPALAVGIRRPALESSDVSRDDHIATKAVANLRHAVREQDELSDRGIGPLDAEAFDLARGFVSGGQPLRVRVSRLIDGLLIRHLRAKGDDAWIRDSAGELELARVPGESWRVPTLVRLHPYRMSAFGSLASDLGGI